MVWQRVYSNSPSIHLMFGVGETLRKGGVEATQMLEMSLSLTPVEVLATSARVPGFHPVIALLFEGDSVEALRTLVRHYRGRVLLDVGVLEALLYSSYFSEEILQLMWDAVNQGFVPYDYEDGYALDNAVSFDTFFPAHCSVTLLGIVKEGILLQGVAREAEHFFLSGLPAVDLREFVPAEVPYLGLPELEVDPCVAHAQAAVGLVGHLVAEAMFANAVAAAEAGAGAVVEGAVAGVAGLVEDVGAAIMRLPNHNVPF
jgi:hypothetical protein